MAMNWKGDPEGALRIVDNCLDSLDDMPEPLAADIRRLIMDGEQLIAHWRTHNASDLITGALVLHYVADHIVNCPIFRHYYADDLDGDVAMMVACLVLRNVPDPVDL